MYRYFDNKNAIVRAIVERQLQEGHAQIEQLRTSADLAASILQTFRLWLARDPSVMSPALYLEMSAEATRDPQIAAVLRESDERIFGALQAWMARDRDEQGLGLAAGHCGPARPPADAGLERPGRQRRAASGAGSGRNARRDREFRESPRAAVNFGVAGLARA